MSLQFTLEDGQITFLEQRFLRKQQWHKVVRGTKTLDTSLKKLQSPHLTVPQATTGMKDNHVFNPELLGHQHFLQMCPSVCIRFQPSIVSKSHTAVL